MLSKTNIEYGQYIWNPIIGCSGAGCECKNICWARGMNNRFKWIDNFEKPEFSYKRLNEINYLNPKSKVGIRILTCFLSDMFGEEVPLIWRQEIYNFMKAFSEYKFYTLTKHPENVCKEDIEQYPENSFFGVTINTQKDVERLDYQFNIGQSKDWLSIEPIMGNIILPAPEYLSWIVIGGYSNKQQNNIINPKWIKNILKQVDENKIPVFMKDNLKNVWNGKLRKEII